MQFTSDLRGGVRVYKLSGNWTDGPEVLRMRSTLKGNLEDGEKSFVIDLEDIGLINSIGLGGLVSCYSSVHREGGTLKLCCLSERNRRALFVSRLVDLFEEYDSVDAAVASFQS